MKYFFSCSMSLSSLFLGLVNVDDNSTAGQRVKGRWLFQSSWRSEYCQCPCQPGGSLTVYMGDAIWAQWSVERRRVSRAEPEWGTRVKGVYWGSTVSGEAVRAAAQGRGKGRARMWSWLEPGFCYSRGEHWNVNQNHTRVRPTVGKGFGLFLYLGISLCLPCVCVGPSGPGSCHCPKDTSLDKGSSESLAANITAAGGWCPGIWPGHRECHHKVSIDPYLLWIQVHRRCQDDWGGPRTAH